MLCLTSSVPSLTRAASKGIEGFGAAKFGMSSDAVQAVLPSMRKAGPQAEGQPAPGDDFPLEIYEVPKTAFGPFDDCNATLRFFVDELFEANVTCAVPPEEMLRHLKASYGKGETSADREDILIWRTDGREAQFISSAGKLILREQRRNQRLSKALWQYMLTGKPPKVSGKPGKAQKQAPASDEGKKTEQSQ